MNDFPRYLFKAVALVLLQVLLVDNMDLGDYFNAFPYVYFLLTLPVNIGQVWLLLIGFMLGLTMDLFTGTGGIHAAACTLIAYYRPFLLRAQSPREGFELHAVPNVSLYGFGWFAGYAALLVGIHHTVLFFLEVFRLTDFFHTLLKVILSGAMTVVMILLIETLTLRDRRRK